MTTCLEKSWSFDLPCVSFVKVYQFVRVLLSLFVLRYDGFDCKNSCFLSIFLLCNESSSLGIPVLVFLVQK